MMDRQTDRQTDGRTDRILIARQRLHCMQRGKNVKLVKEPALGQENVTGTQRTVRNENRHSKVLNIPIFILAPTVLGTLPFYRAACNADAV